MEQSHTDKSYSADLNKLNDLFSAMKDAVHLQIKDCLKGVQQADIELLNLVRQREKNIDTMQHGINDFAVQIIALRQPVSTDLRYVMSTRDAATELERLGDYANNIAKWYQRAVESGGIKGFSDLERIIDYVNKMMDDAMMLYEHDATDVPEKALAVIVADDKLDDMYVSLFRESLTYTLEDTKKITAFLHYMLILKRIERIGDLTTNLAELIYYQHTGEYPQFD